MKIEPQDLWKFDTAATLASLIYTKSHSLGETDLEQSALVDSISDADRESKPKTKVFCLINVANFMSLMEIIMSIFRISNEKLLSTSSEGELKNI